MNINKDNVDEIINSTDKPILVTFWAKWCDPCRLLEPTLIDIEKELDDQALFAKVDIDESISLADRFNVRGIPTVITILKGQVTATNIGVMTKEELVTFITPSLAHQHT